MHSPPRNFADQASWPHAYSDSSDGTGDFETIRARMVSLDDVLSRRGHGGWHGTRDRWIPELFAIGQIRFLIGPGLYDGRRQKHRCFIDHFDPLRNRGTRRAGALALCTSSAGSADGFLPRLGGDT